MRPTPAGVEVARAGVEVLAVFAELVSANPSPDCVTG
jgi:hypothetical protein